MAHDKELSDGKCKLTNEAKRTTSERGFSELSKHLSQGIYLKLPKKLNVYKYLCTYMYICSPPPMIHICLCVRLVRIVGGGTHENTAIGA